MDQKTEEISGKYWYKSEVDYCPVCSSEDVFKYRVYSERPEEWKKRNVWKEVYDYCEG